MIWESLCELGVERLPSAFSYLMTTCIGSSETS